MQKSAEFNIDLNIKDIYGQTAFHVACKNKDTSRDTIHMMIENSEQFKLDIAAKDMDGRTGLQILRQEYGIISTIEF